MIGKPSLPQRDCPRRHHRNAMTPPSSCGSGRSSRRTRGPSLPEPARRPPERARTRRHPPRHAPRQRPCARPLRAHGRGARAPDRAVSDEESPRGETRSRIAALHRRAIRCARAGRPHSAGRIHNNARSRPARGPEGSTWAKGSRPAPTIESASQGFPDSRCSQERHIESG